MNTVTTEQYNMTASEYTSLIARRWLSAWWWAFALPLAVTAVASFYDTRFIYVSLIIIFIIWPMALSIVWFRYALTDEAVRAIRPCTATVDDDKFVFEYPDKINPDDGSIILKSLKPVTIMFSDIKTIEQDGRFMVIIRNSDSRISALTMIPTNAFSDQTWQDINEKLTV
jgi:hypothetical protein